MVRQIGWTVVVRLAATAVLCAALLWVSACSGRSDRQIRQQAQQATERARAEADKAAAEARAAAAQATRQANDVAAGVRAGLHNQNGAHVVDVNAASRADLETLPGVTPATARRIAQNRPYGSPYDLVRKGAVSQAEYDRIAGDVVARYSVF
jgi:DNA uptake protein ComE-like DNA-binding protein